MNDTTAHRVGEPLKKGPTTMKIADLFDAVLRDKAARELPDEDLLVAATVASNNAPGDSLTARWLAMDLVWFALHCEGSATAVAIIRHGTTLLQPKELFEQFLYVTHYREPDMSREHLFRRNRTSIADKVAHVLKQVHGHAVLAELTRVEALRVIAETPRHNAGWMASLLPWCSDVALLKDLVAHAGFFAQGDVVRRLWEIGEQELVFQIADDANPEHHVSDSARRAANSLLIELDPHPRAVTKPRRV